LTPRDRGAHNRGMSQTARVSISGVPSRLAMRVASRRDRRVTMEQRLPFLAIGTEVTSESGDRGRIERVGVVLEGGVPKIVLEVTYDAKVPVRAATRRDETVAYGRASSRPPVGIVPDNQHDHVLPFPLENRRDSLAVTRGSWLARLVSSVLALFSPRTI
jgi:hypothetical protein